MLETGTLLKKKREELGLSIPEVSRSLKIKPRMIQNIESGLIDEMPNKPFVRGFVKSYASFLKLDTASVVDMLDLELGGKQKNIDIEEKTHNSSSWFRKVRTQKKPKNKKLLVFFIVSILALIGANYSFKFLNSTAGNPIADVIKNKTMPSTTLPTEADQKDITEDTKKAVPSIKPTVVSSGLAKKKTIAIKDLVKELEEKKDDKDKPQYSLNGEPMAFAKPVKAPQIPLADPLANPAESLKAALPKKINLKKNETKKEVLKANTNNVKEAPTFTQELRLYATNSTKIIFQIDKDIKRTLNLNKGQTHRLKAFEKVWLSIEDAGNIFIFHNSKDLGKAGKSGETKEIIFDN